MPDGMSAIRVLVLDDDAELREFVAGGLRAAGFRPAEAATVAEAEEQVLRGRERFEALILDVALPDGDGRDLCARLRAAGLRVPVIMLTGSDTEEDIIRGLEAGANDYVAKPCSTAVLIARLRTQVRLHENSMDAVFDLGPWKFYPARKLLRDDRGVKVWLTEGSGDPALHAAQRRRRQQAGAAGQRVGPRPGGVVAHAGNARLPSASENRV